MHLLKTTMFLALTALVVTSCNNKPETVSRNNSVIRIKGSDTEYQMVKSLAEAYGKLHPELQLVVEGGGSNEGIRAMVNGEIDICNASHQMNKKDLKAAALNHIHPNSIIFSVDAVAIITNYKLAVDSLSIEQLSQLLRGEITNWKELGAADMPVNVYGRNKSSGTQDYINEKFMKGNHNDQIQVMKTSGDIVERVMQDPGGIGYVGAGFLMDSTGKPNGKIWAMPIYIDGHRAYSPYETAAVKSGDYVLTRPLYQYVDGVPDQQIEEFILFELSGQGQEIVKRFGFFPINDNQQQINQLKGLQAN